jgi:hypothetical protein
LLATANQVPNRNSYLYILGKLSDPFGFFDKWKISHIEIVSDSHLLECYMKSVNQIPALKKGQISKYRSFILISDRYASETDEAGIKTAA